MLCTSHGRMTSSPTVTEISNSLSELFSISTPLGLGFTTRLQRHTVCKYNRVRLEDAPN